MFKFEPTFSVERFRQVVENIAKHRVCLVTGAQIYGTFLYGAMYGSFGLQRAGLPDNMAENNRLADELIALNANLQADIKDFVDWLDFLKVDDEVKKTAMDWFVNHFPFIATTPEARLISEKLIADLCYSLDKCPSGNEKKIIQQVYDFAQMVYTVAPLFTYAYHNFRNENDVCYMTPTPKENDGFIPKGGKVIKLLTCVLPRTERAVKMTNFVLQPEIGIFMADAFFDATEGAVVRYYDKEGNPVETGLIQIIVDSILA